MTAKGCHCCRQLSGVAATAVGFQQAAAMKAAARDREIEERDEGIMIISHIVLEYLNFKKNNPRIF